MSHPGEEPSVSAAMAAVWQRFRGTMEDRVAAIQAAAAAAGEGRLDADMRSHAEREAHKLAGSLGTFGFAESSRLAREAEEILLGDAPLAAGQGARLGEISAALAHDLERPPGGAPSA